MFDTITLMKGDDVAVITGVRDETNSESPPRLSDLEVPCDLGDDCSSEVVCSSHIGMTYLEIQHHSQLLASQLYYRYGARHEEAVLLICRNNPTAEIIAMIACMRLGCPFIPIDIQWLHNPTRLFTIVKEAKPFMAIISKDDKQQLPEDHFEADLDPAVRLIASMELYRYIVIDSDGSPLITDLSSNSDIRTDLPEINWNSFSERHNSSEYFRSSIHQLLTGGAAALSVTSKPLYILYTSGSTGSAKGVVGTHEGLINRLLWQYNRFPWDVRCEIGCRRTPLTFVDALVEIFAPLLAGVPLWAPGNLLNDVKTLGLASLAVSAGAIGVTRLTVLPSQLSQMLTMLPNIQEVWNSLKLVIISGEECNPLLVDQFRRSLPNSLLVNIYGSTEVSGDVTFAILYQPKHSDESCGEGKDERGELIASWEEIGSGKDNFSDQCSTTCPIGIPIDNNCLYVIKSAHGNREEAMEILQDGKTGELVVIGAHVSLGYHNNEALTHGRYLPAPKHIVNQIVTDLNLSQFFDATPEEIVYKSKHWKMFLTGDLAVRKVNSSNERYFEWIGRVDRQVKIRGVRMELESVERALLTLLHPIRELVVLKHSEEDSLILFLEEKATIEFRTSSSIEIRRVLAAGLGSYDDIFLPSRIEVVSQFPRNSSGKIDRPALQRVLTTKANILSTQGNQRSGIAVVVDTLREVLSVSSASDENLENFSFFELGGNSLNAIEFIFKLQQSLQQANIDGYDLLNLAILRSCPIRELIQAVEHGSLQILQTKETATSATDILVIDALQPKRRRIQGHSTDPSTARQIYKEASSKTFQQLASKSGINLIKLPTMSYVNHNLHQQCPWTLQTQWKHKLLRCVDSSPFVMVRENTAIAASLVTIGSHAGDLTGIDISDGTKLWELQLKRHIEGSVTSALQNGSVIFIACYHGSDIEVETTSTASEMKGSLLAVVADTGELIWETNVPGEIKCAPVVLGQGLYVSFASYDGTLYICSATDGQIIAQGDCQGPVFASPLIITSDDHSYSSISDEEVVSKDALIQGDCCVTIIIGTIKGLLLGYSFQAEKLSLVWFLDIEAPIYASSVLTSSKELGTTAGVLVASVDGFLHHVNIQTGSFFWTFQAATRPIFATPCLGDDAVFFGSHDGMLRCCSLSNGRILWEVDCEAVIFSSPFPILIRTQSATSDMLSWFVVVATTSGDVFLIDGSIDHCSPSNDPQDRIKAGIKLPAEIYSSPVAIIDEDGTLAIFIGCRDDHVYKITTSTAAVTSILSA